MEPNVSGKKIELGLLLNGVVMAKNTYVQKSSGEIKHQLDIACPGNRENITISVDKEDFEKHTELDKFSRRVTVSSFNGRVSFSLLD
jgi:hypothetical protein